MQLSTIAISEIEKNTTINYFYCQPKGKAKTGAEVEHELYEKSLMDQFDTKE